jgi:hypothetical protein
MARMRAAVQEDKPTYLYWVIQRYQVVRGGAGMGIRPLCWHEGQTPVRQACLAGLHTRHQAPGHVRCNTAPSSSACHTGLPSQGDRLLRSEMCADCQQSAWDGRKYGTLNVSAKRYGL